MLKSFLIFIIFLPVGLTALSQDKDTSNVVILLQDVSIKTNRPKIVYKGDTIVFNADAYNTSQGAMLENLIRKLPGIVIDPNGNITYNGKNVREIKVNGKDFFKGNNDIAIKNLPVDIVKEIKVYEEESRQAKHSGIPETEKNQILDVTLKEDLKKTLTFDGHTNMANHKHSDNGLFAQEFTDKWSASIYGNMMNLPQNLDFDNTYGLTASKEIGGMVQWSNKEGEDVSGQINLYATSYYGYTDNDVRSTSINETYLNSGNEQSYYHILMHSIYQ